MRRPDEKPAEPPPAGEGRTCWCNVGEPADGPDPGCPQHGERAGEGRTPREVRWCEFAWKCPICQSGYAVADHPRREHEPQFCSGTSERVHSAVRMELTVTPLLPSAPVEDGGGEIARELGVRASAIADDLEELTSALVRGDDGKDALTRARDLERRAIDLAREMARREAPASPVEGDARTVELLERVAGSHDGWSAGLDPDLRDEIDEWAEARGRRA